jgi:Fe-S-cluster containining protein
MSEREEPDDLAARPRLSGHLSLQLDGQVFEFDVDIPDGPLNVDDLIPLFQRLSSMVAEAAERRVTAQGKAISCRAGCGACCRQAVPVTEGEARRLAALVDDLPEPRRSHVIARFDAAGEALRGAELGRALLARLATGEAPNRSMVTGYFHLGIACPFLEDESCSIHPQRPMTCREYLVTSDPAHCGALAGNLIDRVQFTPMFDRVSRIGRRDTSRGWMLLPQALAFAAHSPPPPRDRPGPEILREVIDSDSGRGQARRS